MEGYKIDFKKPMHIYFIGIGGISMSGLAEILLHAGFTISGSDAKESPLTAHLESMGAKIYYGQRAENIKEDIDCVVYTAAIHPDNPEFKQSKANHLPMMTRAQLLGQMMNNYQHSVAVSGTHGKTTTTSMLAHILLAAQSNPTISVGGVLPIIGGNVHIGSHQLFVTEACEYTNSFLEFFPTMEIILNIEADHLDFFKDIDDIRHSFQKFVKKLPENGILIINNEINNYQEIVGDFSGKLITTGLQNADISAQDIHYDHLANASFTLFDDGKNLGEIVLSVPGQHNVFNALGAIAAALELKIPVEDIKKGLKNFTGANRRFEKKGELVGGITIVDDYAHHPQEIEATLKAARNYPHKKVWCVFQPHTYTRTKALLPEFAKALALADRVVLADIYAARETDTLGISSKDLEKLLLEKGVEAIYLPSFDAIETYLLENLASGDLCITMGAGDIVKVGEKLVGK